ncbi:MAG TPA: hypothetical protein VLB47_06070, partial [Solirubrobacteraceae bacterium]|nr:hypothetical protein [Solirubrobacteraceae bacterium]
MLDPRLYRGALLPILLAVIVFAFSLEDRPAPATTTLAPDAFVGQRAALDLRALAARYPERRPGSSGDEALAGAVARRLRAAGPTWRVSTFREEGRTIDGDRALTSVLARQAGAPGPQLVVVAHRDAAGRGAAAELSGTAALLELARDLSGGRARRTIVLASTSGGSGGAAGIRAALRHVQGPVAAVLVLGDLAGRTRDAPYVVGWSDGGGQSSLALRRTLQTALRQEAGLPAEAERATTQWARLAAPFALGEQGPVAASGVPTALVSLVGERTPPADDELDDRRLQGTGRGVLRAITALDAAAPPAAGVGHDLETLRKVVPAWAVRLLVGSLLLAPALVAIDGFARARRRRRPVGPWLGWIAGTGAVVLGTLLFARVLGLVGLLGPATSPPAPPGAIPLDATGWIGMAAAALAFALLALVLRPLLLRLAGAAGRVPDDGAGVALVLALAAVAVVLWVANPYAAALVVPAAHLWLHVASPEAPLP